MSIEIKHRWNGTVLYTAENAQDVRQAVEEAARQRAYLRGAYLRGADLRGADLRGDINSPVHPLHATRADMWSILDQAPADVPALREAMTEGRINGSVYCDDSGCGCLCGTIGINHTDEEPSEEAVGAALREMGIVKNASRPAEQWWIDISLGDKPLPLDTEEWPSESVFRLSHALVWLDEWVESRTAISKALVGDTDA